MTEGRRVPHPSIAHIDFLSDINRKRAQELLNLPRFQGVEMTQRTTVMHHSLRVIGEVTVISEILLEAGITLDQEKTMFMADFHDDAERRDPAGDIPTSVKMQWTEERRAEFEEQEAVAIRELQPTLDIPIWAHSVEAIFAEYRKGETLEARVTQYLDKWDGMNEATHELICGDNVTDFVPILERYRGILADLEERNADWLPVVRDFLGTDIFSVPTPPELHRKTVDDLDFTSADNLVGSVCDGNPKSYLLWIAFNKAIHTRAFLDLTFPGWIDKFPQTIVAAVDAVIKGQSFITTPSGLAVVSDETTRAMGFAKSLDQPHLPIMLRKIEIMGEDYRRRTGTTRALVGDAFGFVQYPHV